MSLVKKDFDFRTFKDSILSIRRVSKTIEGGRQINFSALVVIGNGKGFVGLGKGKASETAEAVKKAINSARKNIVKIHLMQNRTLHYDLYIKKQQCKLIVRSAPAGTGIISGGVGRAVFESIGVRDVVCKSLGSNNPYAIAVNLVKSLRTLSTPRYVAEKRGVSLPDLYKRYTSCRRILRGKV